MTQNILAESKVGWILTNGSPTGETNTLAGSRFQLFDFPVRGQQKPHAGGLGGL